MPLLARAKRNVGRKLNSSATVSEAGQNMLCAYLSIALLAGLLANALAGLVVGRRCSRAGDRRRRCERRRPELGRQELRMLLSLTRSPARRRIGASDAPVPARARGSSSALRCAVLGLGLEHEHLGRHVRIEVHLRHERDHRDGRSLLRQHSLKFALIASWKMLRVSRTASRRSESISVRSTGV